MCTRTCSPRVLAGKVKQCEWLSVAHLGDFPKLVRGREGKKEMREMCWKVFPFWGSLSTRCSGRGGRQRMKGWVAARHRALTLCSSALAVQAPSDVPRPWAAPGKPLAERLSKFKHVHWSQNSRQILRNAVQKADSMEMCNSNGTRTRNWGEVWSFKLIYLKLGWY